MSDFDGIRSDLGIWLKSECPNIQSPQGNEKSHPTILKDLQKQVDKTRLKKHVMELAAIGERATYSIDTAKIDQARDYIMHTLFKSGYPRRAVCLQKFNLERIGSHSPIVGSNIILRIPGKKLPEKRVILGAHYDCVHGPGANDNATGVAALLETARILAKHTFDYTIEFVFFTGEELDYVGSKFYIKQLSDADKKNIVGVFIADMLGNNQLPGESAEEEDLDLYFNSADSKALACSAKHTIESNLAGVDIVISNPLIRLLELMGGNSDNKEFESIGIPAVLFIEDSNFGLDKNPYMNSSNDIP
ncbi:MAG: M20/M25/M40 family metallo-hydrolase, partial [Candidatus Margulisbacteria bacterium]|nr:M20/M25/M40 family metallo-hydrolase [Candidatus Margulisiibacteriota bacterium]